MAEAQSQSDVAMLWETALNDYTEVSKVDIRKELVAQRSITSIMMEQQHQLESFKTFRHDKGKLDRLRSMISSNADIIQGAAKHITDAASAAFPPSSAILTAFTFVMNASKHVSDDYDMIESFFSVMESFLRRLSLLEGKIPPIRNFQIFLINVFSSLLKLSGLARSYCSKGRFFKWAKALVDGKDPDLVGAYGTLNENLQRLESATIFQTLRTTIEINEKTKVVDQSVKSMQSQLDRNSALTVQTLETSQQTLLVTMRTNTGMQELLLRSNESATTSNELLRRQDEMAKAIARLHTKDKIDKQRPLKSGASRPANFEHLKAYYLENEAEGKVYEKAVDLKLSSVDRLFDWVEEDPAFLSILENQNPLLWISAASGMGKSTLCFRMLQILEDKFAHESTTCVAWFPFDEEQYMMHDLFNMLRCCATRAAEKNERYCSETLTALRHLPELFGLTCDNAWVHLIESRFTRESGRRLILLLDGIDELLDDDFSKLMAFIKKVSAQELAVQVIFTSDPDRKEEFGGLNTACINLEREKIARDMRILAHSKMNTLPRLRKLRGPLRKTILRKVMQKADSFLYIEHIMRKFNALGREGPIRKELENLAENTTGIYHSLLEDCQKNRTAEDQELLRSLLAWLAYAEREVSLGEANSLVKVMGKEFSISIEEELDGRLSRILRLSGDQADQGQDNDIDDENKDDSTGLDDDPVSTDKSDFEYNYLNFQERSLKAYFRQATLQHPEALRCTSIDAQVILTRTCSSILTMTKKELTTAESKLLDYAGSFFLVHLSRIPPETTALSEEQAKTVVESIFNVFTNKNEALKTIEKRGYGPDSISTANLTDEKVLTALSVWAKCALRLPPNSLAYGTLDWFRPLALEPRRVFLPLARVHITNWFSSSDSSGASCAFLAAHSALREGRYLQELKQNPILQSYFGEFSKEESITEHSYEVVANCFWDIVKTASSYKGVGLAMLDTVTLYEPAVKQFNIGLEDITIDSYEKFQLLSAKGSALLDLGIETDNSEKRRTYLTESLKTLEEANDIYRKMDSTARETDSVNNLVEYTFSATAHAAALQGDADLVLSIFREAVEINCPLGPKTITKVAEIIQVLHEAQKLETILAVLSLIPKYERASYLNSDYAMSCLEAAARLGQGQFMLEVFETSWKMREVDGRGRDMADLMTTAAWFSYQALNNTELAKSLLRQAIGIPTASQWGLLESCNRLAQLLYEEFRESRDPMVKKNALDEVRSLLDKLKQAMPEDFNPAESHIITTVALMLRRLGPALELSDRLHAAFRNCLDNLRDDTGANDTDALRRLARILSCIPGFEADASIAYTVQLYALDQEETVVSIEGTDTRQEDQIPVPNVEQQLVVIEQPKVNRIASEHNIPEEPRSVGGFINGLDTAVIDGQQVVVTSSNALIQPSGINTTHINGNSVVVVPPSTFVPIAEVMVPADNIAVPPANHYSMDEGLLGESGSFFCNFCEKPKSNWSQGAAYFCIYCIDCDICEGCYEKKVSQEKGELEPDWRVVCPKGHRHVKGPIEGWRGIKNGVMAIGDREVSVNDWLSELEADWAMYWDTFWSEAEPK